jgi:hypothetical protein
MRLREEAAEAERRTPLAVVVARISAAAAGAERISAAAAGAERISAAEVERISAVHLTSVVEG